jgi:Apea-like HEPN
MKVQDLSEDSEQLLQSLSLLTSERISITGQSTFREDSDFTAFGKATWFRAHPAPRPFTGPGYTVNAAGCQELQNIWTLAHNESVPQNKALALALRRLGFATRHDRPEDRLLDIFIASEAFYLTDSAGDAKDRGELKYRLALRAAVWSEGTLDDWSKRQVFQHMRRGYDVRSTIAHGGEPKPTDLKVKDDRVDLRTFVHTTEEIVRAALYKSLRQASGTGTRLVIPWDDLILPP